MRLILIEAITPYVFPESVKTHLLTLAADSDLLLFGEIHGTQEVPRLLLGLLPDLAAIGYSGLALEMPSDQRDQFLLSVQGDVPPPACFGPSEFRDGRGNAQALSLVQQAVHGGWTLLCFDVTHITVVKTWSERDHGMARNLLDQWERDCPGRKVLGVCGNFHSRLMPPTDPSRFWPSFASSVQQARPDLTVNSVNVGFHEGAYFNGDLKTFGPGPEPFGGKAELRPTSWLGHTLDLYLPRATPVTFLDEGTSPREE